MYISFSIMKCDCVFHVILRYGFSFVKSAYIELNARGFYGLFIGYALQCAYTKYFNLNPEFILVLHVFGFRLHKSFTLIFIVDIINHSSN